MKLPALWCVPATSQKVRLTSKGLQQQIWPVPSRILFENIGYCYIFFKSMAWLSKIQTSFWDVNQRISSVQLLSHVRLFEIPWTAALQASLSITNYQSLLKLMSIESVVPSNHLILCRPLLLHLQSFPASGCFQKWVSSSHQVAKVLEFHLQYQSFQWIFRTDFL